MSPLLLMILLVGSQHVLVASERVQLARYTRGSLWTFKGDNMWKVESTKDTLYACDIASSLRLKAPNAWARNDVTNTGSSLRIELVMSYTAQNCSTHPGATYCRHAIDVYANQSSTPYAGPSIPDPFTASASYRHVGTFSANKLWYTQAEINLNQNTDALTFILESAKPNLYLALHYTGGCLAVSSLEVNYFRCTGMALTRTLVELPPRMAPANGSVRVNGTCTQHSQPLMSADSLYGYCQANGEWSTERFSGECQCDAGYQNTTTGSSGAQCEVCPIGTYKATASKDGCVNCPHNTTQPKTGGKSCNCIMKFYRAINESVSAGCTAQPSAPKNLRTAFINATSVTLVWAAPDSNGGRSDVFYRVECQQCINASNMTCNTDCGARPDVGSTTAAFHGLSAFTYYRFKVFAKNGVSEKAMESDDPPKCIEISVQTGDSVPGKPEITGIEKLSDTTVRVKWKLKEPNGIIVYYEVKYYPVTDPSNKRSVRANSTKATVTIKAGTNYEFQVRARTRLGFGPFSQTQTFKPIKAETSTSVIAVVAGAVAALLFLLLIIIAVFCFLKRRRMKKKHSDSQLTLEMDAAILPTSGQRMYIDPSTYGDPMEALQNVATEIAKDNIKLDKIIGGGEFADVYKATLKAEMETVAVKILKSGSSHKNREDFCIEASIMGQFDHPNVIALKGVITKTRPMMIVTEFLENGSLEHFLKTNDGNLTTLQLVGMARGVAAGMTYLSGMNFIHRDIAARNILVSDNLATKVSDFGLSRELDDTADKPGSEYQTQGGKIPVRWTAPEAIKYRKFSSSSDVWSYGILLWEIMSFSERPYWTWDNYQVMDRVEGGYRLPAPMNCPKVIHNLMLDCWNKDKASRPKFADIETRLMGLIKSPEKMKDAFAGTLSMSRKDATNFAMLGSVGEWLEDIKMGQYSDAFSDHGYVDLNQVRNLQNEDLERLGIKLVGHRNKISKSIKTMNKSGELAV